MLGIKAQSQSSGLIIAALAGAFMGAGHCLLTFDLDPLISVSSKGPNITDNNISDSESKINDSDHSKEIMNRQYKKLFLRTFGGLFTTLGMNKIIIIHYYV